MLQIALKWTRVQIPYDISYNVCFIKKGAWNSDIAGEILFRKKFSVHPYLSMFYLGLDYTE